MMKKKINKPKKDHTVRPIKIIKVKESSPKLNPHYKRALLDILYTYHSFESTNTLRKEAELDWTTTSKYLKVFHQKKWLIHKKSGNRDYWKLTNETRIIIESEKEKKRKK